MPRSRLRTIDDTVLASTILEMRDDYGYWDQDPIVFKDTKKAFYALGDKMAKGAREVVRRVEKEGGIEVHEPLKRIFTAASKLSAEDRSDSHAVYEALRNVARKREPKPAYAF